MEWIGFCSERRGCCSGIHSRLSRLDPWTSRSPAQLPASVLDPLHEGQLSPVLPCTMCVLLVALRPRTSQSTSASTVGRSTLADGLRIVVCILSCAESRWISDYGDYRTTEHSAPASATSYSASANCQTWNGWVRRLPWVRPISCRKSALSSLASAPCRWTLSASQSQTSGRQVRDGFWRILRWRWRCSYVAFCSRIRLAGPGWW